MYGYPKHCRRCLGNPATSVACRSGCHRRALRNFWTLAGSNRSVSASVSSARSQNHLLTRIPKLRAVPATTFMADSTDEALRSGILASATSPQLLLGNRARPIAAKGTGALLHSRSPEQQVGRGRRLPILCWVIVLPPCYPLRRPSLMAQDETGMATLPPVGDRSANASA
jgi:hypothetical protein